MKDLIEQLAIVHVSMLSAAEALLKAGHPDKCKEMSGAASIVDGWVNSIVREYEQKAE